MADATKKSWVIREKFSGLNTKKDPSKVQPGSAVAGFNVTFTDGDRISSRRLGYATYPDTAAINTETIKVASIKTFRRRDGENILMRNQAGALEFFDETTIGWVMIQSGFTPGVAFGYAEQNINTDQVSYVYLGNAHQNYARWTGAKSHLSVAVAAVDTTVTVKDASGFPSPTGTLVMAGVRKYYSSRTNTVFTLTAAAGMTHAVGSTVVAGLQSFSAPPKGNILHSASNRIFMAGITSVLAAVYFSQYGDAKNFVGASLVTDSTADSPGIFNLAEGGGPVIGIAQDENATYIVKPSIIYRATLSDSLYALTPLKPFDGKSQTTGGIVPPFAGENGVFFITPDKKIYYLTRVADIDYPQLVPISDVIKPTVEALFFDKSRGIVFEDKAYIACSTVKNAENNVVLVYDIRNNLWHNPITGWNVTDWAIYKKTIGTNLEQTDDELFFASNNTKNVFKVIPEPVDGEFDVKATVSMGQEVFDKPAERKAVDNFFFEGYIHQDTTLTIDILFDDNGYTQRLSATVRGDDETVQFGGSEINEFGSSVFGRSPFGVDVFGQDATSSLRKFRVYTKEKLRDIPFYNLEVAYTSEGANQQWDILRYGFHVGVFEQSEDRRLYKSFS